jgi:hypothetical protein
MSPPSDILFAYEPSKQMLVMQALDGSDRAVGYTVTQLKAWGWTVDHADMMASLPRFGAPPALQVAHDMGAARAMAKNLNGMRGKR